MKKINFRLITVYLTAFFEGMRKGVSYWEIVIFENRIPRWVCWSIAIALAPINILFYAIMKLTGKEKRMIEKVTEILDL